VNELAHVDETVVGEVAVANVQRAKVLKVNK
jgi:hypothetical protein